MRMQGITTSVARVLRYKNVIITIIIIIIIIIIITARHAELYEFGVQLHK